MHHKSKNYERTLVILKPDAVQRGLMGQILSRFEQKGLKIVAMRMFWPDEKLAAKHYYWSEEEKRKNGERTIDAYKAKGIEIDKDPVEIAETVIRRLKRFMTTGPVLAMVVEGAHAVDWVRKIVGKGNPLQADIGTIRADFTIDSYVLADEVDRVARNLIHASDSVREAEREIKVWFKESEIYHYHLAIERVLYSTEWEDDDQNVLKSRAIK